MEEQDQCPYSLCFGTCDYKGICALKKCYETCPVYQKKEAAERAERRGRGFVGKPSGLETVKLGG